MRGGEANSAVIYASLTGNVTPHTGIGIKGTLRYPSGKNVPLEFQDMGYGPDATQGDGVYSALAENCSEPGNYRVTVAFSNTGQAVETNQRYAFLPPPGIKDGEAYVVAEKGHALPHKLERVVATTFQIEGGKVTDDSRGIIAREKPIDFERVKSYLERGEKALKRGAYDDAEDYAKACFVWTEQRRRVPDRQAKTPQRFRQAVEPYAKAVELEPESLRTTSSWGRRWRTSAPVEAKKTVRSCAELSLTTSGRTSSRWRYPHRDSGEEKSVERALAPHRSLECSRSSVDWKERRAASRTEAVGIGLFEKEDEGGILPFLVFFLENADSP